MSQIAPLAFPVVCRTPAIRKLMLATFTDEGVETRPMIAGNITRQPFWTGDRPALPGADLLHECAFYCGLYPEMTEDEIRTIERCLR